MGRRALQDRLLRKPQKYMPKTEGTEILKDASRA
jgi:hypothetical protein